MRMIESQAMRDTSAAIVAADEETVVAEPAHEIEHVLRHCALAVSGVIGRAFRFARVAVAAQVRHHEREALAKPRSDGVPDSVRLRKAV
jgi:hypothetical protein